MVFIEAGRVIGGSEELKDASLLPTPAGSSSGGGRARKGAKGRG